MQRDTSILWEVLMAILEITVRELLAARLNKSYPSHHPRIIV